ncbi:MAG: hypothetical protein FWD26_06805 [Treponema sp.]|nr:hypothetical protein [Treponema sp.]
MVLKRILQAAFFIVILAFLSISCSRTKPEIVFGFIQLVLYQGNPEPLERFSFFIIPEDDDGIENLEEIFLYHDREQLRWHIKHDEWVKYTHERREWIGSRGIAVREGGLPKGVYRAVLVNKGGESSERNFTFDGTVHYPFPELSVSGGMYTVNSEWPVNRLIGYDRNGNYIMTVVLDSLSGNISQLRLTSAVRTVALWAEDEDNFCSAFTNAVSVN